MPEIANERAAGPQIPSPSRSRRQIRRVRLFLLQVIHNRKQELEVDAIDRQLRPRWAIATQRALRFVAVDTCRPSEVAARIGASTRNTSRD
jgi:hypothetical protein